MGWVLLQILRPEACEFKVSLGVQGQQDLWIKAVPSKVALTSGAKVPY